MPASDRLRHEGAPDDRQGSAPVAENKGSRTPAAMHPGAAPRKTGQDRPYLTTPIPHPKARRPLGPLLPFVSPHDEPNLAYRSPLWTPTERFAGFYYRGRGSAGQSGGAARLWRHRA